ncbi:MAG TPA: hypothetical protein PKD85_12410 [Saprospiraceae bacterium]|nr:hypothetical protein [Saprospiraceae bacterium]
MEKVRLYQVSFVFDDDMDVSGVLPYHDKVVSTMVSQGIVISHSITKKKNKVIIVFKVASESELQFHIDKLPITPFTWYDYERLESIEVYSVFSTYSLN